MTDQFDTQETKLIVDAKTSTMPAFAEKARDLGALREAVVDAAAVGTGLWFSYLFVLLYLTISVASVTYRDLFLESPIRLPFLGVDLPLTAFFAVGPILFLIVHAYVLLHFVLLAGKIGVFHSELQAQVDDEDLRSRLRRQLPSNTFAQFLAGPREVREGIVGFVLRLIAWISLVIGPLALLVLFQFQFLPYHDEWITWGHPFAILLDLSLLWSLWPSIIRTDTPRLKWRYRRPLKNLAVVSLMTLFLVFALATFPGEWQEARLARLKSANSGQWLGAVRYLHEVLFVGRVDEITRKTETVWSNRLVLDGINVIDYGKFDSVTKVAAMPESVSLSGRDLQRAVFNRANLQRADFTGANLRFASFDSAQLHRAVFDYAQLQGASLKGAQMRGASLAGTSLNDAYLSAAELQAANLTGAILHGATLTYADLQAALLIGARVEAANFSQARLQGANLTAVRIKGSSFNGASLSGTSCWGSQAHAADFSQASLWRTTAFPPHQYSSLVFRNATREAPENADSMYEELKLLVSTYAPREKQETALKAILSFVCSNESLQSEPCIRGATPPKWWDAVNQKSVDDNRFARALEVALMDITCGQDARLKRYQTSLLFDSSRLRNFLETFPMNLGLSEEKLMLLASDTCKSRGQPFALDRVRPIVGVCGDGWRACPVE